MWRSNHDRPPRHATRGTSATAMATLCSPRDGDQKPAAERTHSTNNRCRGKCFSSLQVGRTQVPLRGQHGLQGREFVGRQAVREEAVGRRDDAPFPAGRGRSRPGNG